VTDYAVTGKKRSGKGLFCAGLIRDALLAGRRVATNMDIRLDEMLPPLSKSNLIRLPDCPNAEDMELIGKGYEGESIDDERNGLIILDEASKYFNTRQWGDKGRQPLLDWLIHSGKLRWDVYYQMQGLTQVDKQLRETQVEYHVSVKRTDRWPIPFITPLSKLIGLNVRFPKMHMGIFRHGVQHDAMLVDRKFYRAKDLYKAYDTLQKISPITGQMGISTMLSAYDLKGKKMNKWDLRRQMAAGGLVIGMLIGFGGGFGAAKYQASRQTDTTLQVVDDAKVKGVINADVTRIILTDGRVLVSESMKADKTGTSYKAGGRWYAEQK